jgi:hypothetical protein
MTLSTLPRPSDDELDKLCKEAWAERLEVWVVVHEGDEEIEIRKAK